MKPKKIPSLNRLIEDQSSAEPTLDTDKIRFYATERLVDHTGEDTDEAWQYALTDVNDELKTLPQTVKIYLANLRILRDAIKLQIKNQ
mgnify:FL=1